MHYLLSYTTSPAYLARRGEFRAAHLALAWAAADRGELLLAGAHGDPVDGALLLFQGDGPEAAIRFAEADPYVAHGLITAWTVRPWHTVVGATCSAPLRPAPPA